MSNSSFDENPLNKRQSQMVDDNDHRSYVTFGLNKKSREKAQEEKQKVSNNTTSAGGNFRIVGNDSSEDVVVENDDETNGGGNNAKKSKKKLSTKKKVIILCIVGLILALAAAIFSIFENDKGLDAYDLYFEEQIKIVRNADTWMQNNGIDNEHILGLKNTVQNMKDRLSQFKTDDSIHWKNMGEFEGYDQKYTGYYNEALGIYQSYILQLQKENNATNSSNESASGQSYSGQVDAIIDFGK